MLACVCNTDACVSLCISQPDAYYGQNTKIRETLNNLILKSPQEWHTQVGLPFVRIEGEHPAQYVDSAIH